MKQAAKIKKEPSDPVVKDLDKEEKIPLSKLSISFTAAISLIVAIATIIWSMSDLYHDIDKEMLLLNSKIDNIEQSVIDIRRIINDNSNDHTVKDEVDQLSPSLTSID